MYKLEQYGKNVMDYGLQLCGREKLEGKSERSKLLFSTSFLF